MSHIRQQCCHTCGQPLSGSREGVYLTPAKLRIYDYIKTHPGRSLAQIAGSVYPGVPLDQAKKTVASSITQINDRFIETPIRIRGPRFGIEGYQVFGTSIVLINELTRVTRRAWGG